MWKVESNYYDCVAVAVWLQLLLYVFSKMTVKSLLVVVVVVVFCSLASHANNMYSQNKIRRPPKKESSISSCQVLLRQ